MAKAAYVYILASKKHGTLYTGVTSNLGQRMYQHKHHLLEGFTGKYDVTRLVWYEHGEGMASAISLEKKIKNRNRQWKIALIERNNPNWDDLVESWVDSATSRRMTPLAMMPLLDSVPPHSFCSERSVSFYAKPQDAESTERNMVYATIDNVGTKQ